ncbi:FRG domain-containing protein [Pseudomonas sp. NPDC008258]|uniref:FRG domain-containing protein n=1 Tax=Pseudomonas sp. NPDC008258 TaxID=3364418 RepID=UPI0036EBF677
MRSVDQLFAHLHNVNPIADRVSPACDISQVNESTGTPAYVDPLYGNCWSWTPAHGAAVYGLTEKLPEGPLDHLANGTFLRVPFRRVPVIEVRSIEEVRAIAGSVKSGDPNFSGVWRGQSTHYTTEKAGRTKDELLRLYGTEDVSEPSLLPSAARTKLYFPDSFGAWSALLDLYVHERALEQGMQRELLSFVNSYRYRMWGFATAQHYGLPSVGLDVTDDINVALFFALHTFQTNADGVMTATRATASAAPIVYGLGGFSDHELFKDENLAPRRLLCTRPAAQSAMFFSTGWGHAPNNAAQRIYVALKLVGHENWKFETQPTHYFPKPQHDEFLEFLLERKSDLKIPVVQDLLSKIYHVESPLVS